MRTSAERAGWTLSIWRPPVSPAAPGSSKSGPSALAARWLLDVLSKIVTLSTGQARWCIVNDRADLARLAAADGVHVGQEDLAPAAVRPIVGPDAMVGLSTHTAAQIDAGEPPARQLHRHRSGLRHHDEGDGLRRRRPRQVRRAAARTAARGLPLVAIGGITLDRARSVIEAGAQSVAVITDLLTTGDPTTRVQQFLRALGETS